MRTAIATNCCSFQGNLTEQGIWYPLGSFLLIGRRLFSHFSHFYHKSAACRRKGMPSNSAGRHHTIEMQPTMKRWDGHRRTAVEWSGLHRVGDLANRVEYPLINSSGTGIMVNKWQLPHSSVCQRPVRHRPLVSNRLFCINQSTMLYIY